MAITLPSITIQNDKFDFAGELLANGMVDEFPRRVISYMSEIDTWAGRRNLTHAQLKAWTEAVGVALNSLESRRNNLGTTSVSPAGAGNTSTIVHETIGGRLYFATAITGSESLEKLLSNTTANENWLLMSSGITLEYDVAISHLYPPLQEVKVWDDGWLYFTLAETSIRAQRAINPTSPSNVVYLSSGMSAPVATVNYETGYLSGLIPVEEGNYIDYSSGKTSTTVRSLYTTLGCDMAELHAAVGTQVYEPAPTVAAIKAAITQAASTGGIVKPTATAQLDIRSASDILLLEDNVIFDGSRIGLFDLLSGDRLSAVDARAKQNIGITNVKGHANNQDHYIARADECRNVCIQNIESIPQEDQNTIRLSTLSRNTTVRFCKVNTGRDTAGNNTAANQHGAAWGSQTGPGIWSPSARFGIVYSYGIACYSNWFEHTDGHAMDIHGGNGEIAGNWCDDNQRGSKFPHSANLLIHHNRFGGVIPGENAPIVSRIYSANDWNVGVGYECDQMYFVDNIYDNNGGLDIRVDGIHGDVYWMHNTYTNSGGSFIIAPANGTSTDPNSFNGTVYMYGDDLSQPMNNSAGASKLVTVTDSLLVAKNYSRMIELMNAPKNAAWSANSNYPLPTVVAR